MNGKRNINWDIYRGIACWFVIWGHTIQYGYAGDTAFYENMFFRFIYGFHMPLFMMISGHLFCISCQKYDLNMIMNKQLHHIAYPLFIWNGIHFFCKLIFFKGKLNSFYEFLCSVYRSFMGMWFLWSVLIISVLIALIYFNFLIPMKKGTGYFIGFIILILLPKQVEPCKTMNIWMYPYFLAGFLLSENWNIFQKKLGKWNRMKYIFIVLYPVLLHYFHFRDYIYTSGIDLFDSQYGFMKQLQIDIYRWILGYVGIIFMIVVLQELFRKSVIKNFLHLLFGKLGQITLQVYVIQRILLEEIFGKTCKMIMQYGGG